MNKVLISILFCIISTSTFAKVNLVIISKKIVIDKPIEQVFFHVSNTMNDYTWREEVNEMSGDGNFEVGTTYTEDAHIGLQPNFITKTQLLDLQENDRAYYETPKDAKYFLSSLREVKSLTNNKTLFTYTVIFDSELSKVTLGLRVPRSILRISYGVIINKYLINLKAYFTP